MSDIVDDILKHHGVLGMKWGVRRSKEERQAATDVALKTIPGRKIKTSGGKNQPASEDAKKAAATRQKAKASTTDALSNQELKALVERMNLEANFNRLSATQKSSGRKFVESLFKDKNKRDQTIKNLNDIPGVGAVKAAHQIGDAISNVDLSKIGS